MFKQNVQKVLVMSLCLLQMNCTGNVFSDMASKNTDEALFNDARTALNNQDYQIAIDIILNDVSVEGRQTTQAKELLAGGYAGKCGLNFLDFVDALSHASGSAAFKLTANLFLGVTVDPASCLSALNTMETIAPAASRTQSQNIFAAIAAMSLMGTSTRLYTDNSPAGGDGTQDSAGISCGLTNAQVDYIILGFGFMSENFSYMTSSQLGSTGSAFSSVISTCASLGTSCNIKDPSAITPLLRDVFRKLLNTQDYGVGTVVTSGSAIAIATACP